MKRGWWAGIEQYVASMQRQGYPLRGYVVDDRQWYPPRSLADATLWLRKYHPKRLPAWLAKQDPMLTAWLGEM